MSSCLNLNHSLAKALGRQSDDLFYPHKVNFYSLAEEETPAKPDEDANYTQLAILTEEFVENYQYNRNNGWQFLTRQVADQLYNNLKETTLEAVKVFQGNFDQDRVRKLWTNPAGGMNVVEVVLFAKGP